ncbi:MAG TPA: hypothetical protein VFX06_15570 [Stellaceae bacterium]|nr:hypothetical protein [Stellaceae bacterium]
MSAGPARRPRALSRLAPAAALGLLLVAACQPLPHPFADDRPPAALLRVRDSISVAVAPVAGTPRAAATRLPAAMAKALLKHEIPASDKTASLSSYQLFGRIAELRPKQGAPALAAVWRLYDAKGRTVGERQVRVPLAPANAAVERLAALSADRLAPLLQDDMPASRPVANTAAAGPRVAIGKINGAPGDGNAALARALAAVLPRDGVAIVAAGDKPDLMIDGTVALTPATAGQEHVALVWRVRRPGGGQIGTVGQQNDVPKGLLDGKWGDLAYNIAIAASDGIVQLVARGLPPKS